MSRSIVPGNLAQAPGSVDLFQYLDNGRWDK